MGMWVWCVQSLCGTRHLRQQLKEKLDYINRKKNEEPRIMQCCKWCGNEVNTT